MLNSALSLSKKAKLIKETPSFLHFKDGDYVRIKVYKNDARVECKIKLFEYIFKKFKITKKPPHSREEYNSESGVNIKNLSFYEAQELFNWDILEGIPKAAWQFGEDFNGAFRFIHKDKEYSAVIIDDATIYSKGPDMFFKVKHLKDKFGK